MSRRPSITAKGRGRRIAGVAGLGLGQALAAGLAAFATRDVFGALHAGAPLPAPPLLAIAIAGLALGGLRIAERTIAERIGCDYAAAVRETLFLHVARLPPSVVAGRTRGGLALRFVGDLSAVRNWVSRGLVRLVSASIALPSSLLVLALLDWRLALAAAVPLILGLAVLGGLGGPLHRAHERLRRRRSRLAIDATERLAHGAALRLVGLVGAERKRLADRARSLADAATAQARLTGTARALPDAVTGLATAAILTVAALQDVAPAVAAGALAALGLTMQPLRSLADVRDRHEAWRVASTRIDRALAAPALGRRRHARQTVDTDQPALSIDFAAGAAGPAMPLIVEAGETRMIDGTDGAAGRLLLAAAGVEPAAGERIRVFGRKPANLPTGTIAYIGPASPIIRGSLRQNLLLGVSGKRSDEAVERALRAVGLDCATGHREGLAMQIGEAGRTLSHLERIRLLSARAVLGTPRLILLDAAGFALPDPVLEDLLKALKRPDAAVVVAWMGGQLPRSPAPTSDRDRAVPSTFAHNFPKPASCKAG